MQIARQLQRAGYARYSIGGVWELLRFQGIMTRGDRYRLNNNFRAWYARRIMACEPDLVGFFEVRGGGADHE